MQKENIEPDVGVEPTTLRYLAIVLLDREY